VTGQALLAVNGAAFPLNPVPRTASRAVAGGGGAASATGGVSAAGGSGEKAHSSGKAPTKSPTETQPSGPGDPVPSAPASSGQSDGDGGGIPGWLIATAAAALIAAAVWGGWVMYRRRLP
jgi:hypothetical protein